MNVPLLLGLLIGFAVIGVCVGIYWGTRRTPSLVFSTRTTLVELDNSGSLMDWVYKYKARNSEDDEILDLLKKSGNPKGWSVADFRAARVRSMAMFGGGAALLIIVVAALAGMLTLSVLAPIFAAFGAWFGYGQPKRTLTGTIKKRVLHVTLTMPSLLTAVALADGAGYTPEAALKLATDELVPGTLKGEMEIVLQLLASGSSFASALANFRERVPAPIVEEFTQKLYDGATTGQSLSKSLTDLAEVAFSERTAAMEMAAQKASQKILFVIVPALILPADLGALMFPIAQTLQSGLGGGGL